jgi:hypothetical protein
MPSPHIANIAIAHVPKASKIKALSIYGLLTRSPGSHSRLKGRTLCRSSQFKSVPFPIRILTESRAFRRLPICFSRVLIEFETYPRGLMQNGSSVEIDVEITDCNVCHVDRLNPFAPNIALQVLLE